MTILFYLNDVEEGGETAFPVANNNTLNYQVHKLKKITKNYLVLQWKSKSVDYPDNEFTKNFVLYICSKVHASVTIHYLSIFRTKCRIVEFSCNYIVSINKVNIV